MHLVALAAVVACGGDQPTDVRTGPYALVECSSLALAATRGLPLDEIPIGALPTSMGSPVAAALDVTGSQAPTDFALVVEGESGGPSLLVPLHPTAGVDGGSVTLTFTDGSSACAPVDFTIDPLPAAPGELAAVVDLLQAVITDQAALVDATPEELRATALDDMDPSYWPLAMMQTLLDDAANEESLRAIAEGAFGAEALDWAERLVARTDLRSALEAAAAPPADAVAPEGLARFSAQDLLCRPEFIANGADLDRCMSLAAEMARRATGASREVAEQIQKVFGDLADAEIPVAGQVRQIFAVVFWIIYTEREAVAATYPSVFTAAEASASPERMREDDGSDGMLRLTVTAASLGYDMQDQIVEGLDQIRAVIDQFGSFEFATGDAELDEFASRLVAQAEKKIRATDFENLEIPASSVTRTLGGDGYVDARVITGTAVETGILGRYFGKEAGTATVSLRTRDGAFGGQQIADQVDVTVLAIRLTISPAEVWLLPDAVKSFTVKVGDAVYPDEIARDEEVVLQGAAELTVAPGGDVHDILYVAPQSPDYQKPDLLTVQYTGTEGARGSPNAPPRRAIATIRFASVRITTDPTCLEPGDTLRIEAEVPAGDPQIVWTTDAGTITQDGLFTAPEEPATVEITASLQEAPTSRDAITLQVGGCSCQASLSLGGVGGAPTSIEFTLSQDLQEVIVFGWNGPDGAGNLGFGANPFEPETLPVGSTGDAFVASGFGTVANVSFSAPDDPDNPSIPPLTVIIEENTGQRLVGTVAGAVNTGDPESFPELSFVFVIEGDPMWSTQTNKVCRLD
jgi:hypothetical protein